MNTVRRAIACSAAMASFWSLPGTGAEFALRPNIAVEGSYNDNLFLQPDSQPQLSTWRAVVYPGLNLIYRIGALSVDALASAAINRYINNADLNTDDQNYRFNTRYDFGRQNVNLNFRFNRIAALRTELIDTGELRSARQRERVSVTPTWQYSLSEVSSVTFGYMFFQQSYTDPTTNVAEPRPLTGSTSHGANVLFDYSLTKRLKIGTQLEYTNVVGDTGYQADNYMLRFPLDYDYSETFRTSVNVGARYVDPISSGGGGNSGSGDAGFLFGFKFFKKFDIGTIDIQLARDVSPSGFGTQRQRDQARLRLTGALTETLDANLLTQFIRNEDLGDSSSNQNRDFFEVSPSLRWRWASNWDLNAGYLFRAQKLDSTPGTAYGNLFFVTVGYSFEDYFLPD